MSAGMLSGALRKKLHTITDVCNVVQLVNKPKKSMQKETWVQK